MRSTAARLGLLLWACTMQRLAGWSGSALVRASSRGAVRTRALASAARPQMVGPEARETIFAVSSGQGVRCGVTVIRVSGRSARLALERMTPRGRRDPTLAWLVPRAATLTQLLEPIVEGGGGGGGGAGEDRLDSALVLWFPAPRSFTGEDVAELHVHGGRATVAAVLAALGRLPDFRLAERGEYSRRAFANGRMDLTEAEGLADLLAANTDAQRRQALAQMGGAARARLDGWRAELLDCLAHTEAVIDFGEDADDLGGDVLAAVGPRVARLAAEIAAALAVGRRGELLRDGPRVVIVGAPNAGKSSLLNRLAERPAAIVTPIAGTTRDILEVELELGGLPLRLCDTAGLRAEAEADAIEAEGMRRARALLAEAPLRLLVADVSAGRAPSLAELGALLAGDALGAGAPPEAAVRDAIVVLNKVDALALPPGAPPPRVDGVPAASQFLISCETGEGFEQLLGALEARVRALLEGGDEAGEAVVVTRARHREHLEQTLLALERFAAHDGLMVDLAAEELRIAAAEVGKVTGRIQIEEMLDIIFRDFCIGK